MKERVQTTLVDCGAASPIPEHILPRTLFHSLPQVTFILRVSCFAYQRTDAPTPRPVLDVLTRQSA